jgi:imidazolonepropionase-like amidohydrolase
MQGPRTTFAEARRNHERELQELAEFFEQARRYQKAKAAGGPAFKADVRLEAMLPVLDRKAPVMVTAVRERAIREAIQFADRQKIRMILASPRRFGDTLKDIKAKDIPVILGPTLELPLEDDDAYDSEFALPAELHKAGVKFAFGSFANQFARNLPYQAANAVAYGLPYDEALKAVTLYPAEIWGVAEQYGSIEKGKYADLMVTDGDPLETKTQVKRLFIKGREVDLESKHTKLYKKYMARP